ncbi:MAG: aminotransferase class I/II-fold pyridoxal phosphate-dependent enzyme, partial [Bradymonadaceae bacterium]
MSPIDSNTEKGASIPLCVPEIRGNEWEYVRDCLDTNWVSSAGSYVDRFEEEFADYVGADHAVSTVNGTSALHVALRCCGVEPGDEVVVSTLTFIAPANAVRYRVAEPV